MAVMEVSTLEAARRLRAHFRFDSGDKVLDYGCGPGFLTDFLVKMNIKVTGIDINEEYIARNRARHPAQRFIHHDSADLTSKIGDYKFDYIILLSVVQYFRDLAEVAEVVKALRQSLSPGGRIILADVLDQNTSAARDGMASFFECVRRGRGLAFLQFAAYVLLSGYRRTSRQNPLLLLTENEIAEVARSNGFQFRKHKGMTVHPSRTTYELLLVQ
jgi:2-polyprenyl-3-methyl-5-hydroxy-6-metoxy-1,4-benzoquinol methylase